MVTQMPGNAGKTMAWFNRFKLSMSGIQHDYIQISTSSTVVPPKIIKLEQSSEVGYSGRT
jgi:hypothetical protein